MQTTESKVILRSMEKIDSSHLRTCLGQFGTGVCVVTTTTAEQINVGVTINSFTSASLDPPLVLFCLGIESQSHQHFTQAKHCVINILSQEQENLSREFARPSSANWENIPYQNSSKHTVPVLDKNLAYLECTLKERYEAGDHTIFIAHVDSATIASTEQPPLLFFRGAYDTVASQQSL